MSFNKEFPGRVPDPYVSGPWVGVNGDDRWLEVEARNIGIQLGPLSIWVAVDWSSGWRPRPWRSRKRRYEEWLAWCQRIHTTETPEQHRRRAEMLTR